MSNRIHPLIAGISLFAIGLSPSGCGSAAPDSPASAADAGVIDAGVSPSDSGPPKDTTPVVSDASPGDTASPDVPPSADASADTIQPADGAPLSDTAWPVDTDKLPDVSPPDASPPDAGPPALPYWEELPDGYGQLHFEGLETDSEGKTSDLTLMIPTDTLSFSVMLSGAPKDVWMRVVKMVVPPGFPVVKGQGNVSCVTCANRVYASQILTTSLFPNSPDVAFKSKGKYKMALWQFSLSNPGNVILVGPWSQTPITARVLIKSWPYEQAPTAGVIDLNLYFTGAGGLSADLAPADPRIVAALAELNTVYTQAGISLGQVRYFDTPADTPQTVETTIAVDSDLSVLFGTSADAPPGVNIYFVDQILREELEDDPAIVLGIAGGIPGPPFVNQGSPHSGVALALTDIGDDGVALGRVLAHELGHYLGLFHTSEQGDGGFDPIADTPEGVDGNLMYWAYTGSTALSAGQTFVMLRHPSVWLPAP